ncbi:MAG: phospholipid carrier-dependent glycosyltransferase [Chloroflexi bacterium]|nr:phospholipid carrier-dependent glycosyltransferase [Chloroflexota bacterium]MCY4248433.1 phospholipid carrier-dependent glycosyltransferase [Chloroflexota bacterium]
MTNRQERIQSARLCLLLFALMIGVYLLSFRAVIQSGDTLRAFDAITSYARYGDWLLDESAWTELLLSLRESDDLPLREYDVEERLQAQIAAPLLRLAQSLPRLGNIHAVWLLNVIVVALTIALVFLLARALGYDDATSALVALGSGLATNLWAYSQTLFREPLAAFFIVLALLCLQISRRQSGALRLFGWLCAAGALLLASQVKMSAALAAPAVLVFALPEPAEPPNWLAKLYKALWAVPLAALTVLMLLDPLPGALLDLLAGLGLNGDHAGLALRSYLFSPGASIWGTSPVALLAVGGCALLIRRGRRRLPTTIFLLLAAYALGHALLVGRHWFGGLSFPPRFLTPVLPALMLGSAPLIQRMLRGRNRRLAGLCSALLIYGVWIQFSAVSLSWEHYSASLPAESAGLAEWLPSLMEPQYFRWFVLPRRWADLGFEFLWTRANLPVWGISFGALVAFLALCLWRSLRDPGSRWRYAALPLACLCLPLTLLNLSAAYDKDPRTRSQSSALREALDYVVAHSKTDDVLLLGSDDYAGFVMNHLDAEQPRPITLPRPPAQAASEKQPALLESANPNDWIDRLSIRVIQHLAHRQERLWLLAETSPFMRWSFRPLERYLALHVYPLREVALEHNDPTVRLLEYSTRAAFNPLAPFAGDIASDLRYGERIHLDSLTLPNGLRYQPGATIEVSLHWRADAPLREDYTVALFAAEADSQQVVAQGHDSAPQGGFAPTSSWTTGGTWDNRALRLPDDSPKGELQLWLAMYRWDSEIGDIRRLPVTSGQSVHAGEIGVLPVKIIVG